MGESLERRIAQAARKQRGYVTREQLIGFGMPVHQIEYWLKLGRLIRVYHGVYAVGYVSVNPIDQASAALLACGPQATLVRSSARSLWGIDKDWRRPFEVAVPGERRPKGITVHRRVTLAPQDRRHHYGLWVTSPARTILDLAAPTMSDAAPTVPDAALTRAIDGLRLAGYLTIGQLAEAVIRCSRHRGTKRVRPYALDPAGPTRSDLEIAWKTLLVTFDLPWTPINVPFNGYVLDALFVQERVIVELDGWETHKTRQSFESDRERDASNLALGYPTVRVTWPRMTQTPAAEAARIERILERRRGELGLARR